MTQNVSTIDDIKAKLDLVDYLREQGVELKPAGSSMKARCPFHNEKSPSFMVNPAKQVFYCFGCSKGGTIFDFVMLREGLEFGEALRLLAERAGVQLEQRDPRLEGKKTRGLSVLEETARFFEQQLIQSAVAQRYVAQRRIAPAMVEQFQIGYAPDAWDALTKHLTQRGYTNQEVVDAGLAIVKQRSTPSPPSFRSYGGQASSPSQREGEEQTRGLAAVGLQLSAHSYDRFRHRLMFPIHDAMGRVVGFTGRILDGGTTVGPEPAKYVNTPETELYKKGAILYGLAFARDAIRTQQYAVLVEGQMDVVASHGAGIAATIAVSGTALTEQQLRLLKRYTSRLHVAFDADPAGEGAAERGIDAALDAGFDVRVIATPRDADGTPLGKDADEILQRDTERWRAAIADAILVLDHFIARVRDRYDLASPAGKRDAGRVLLEHLAHIADPIERAAWVSRSADVIGVPDAALHEALRRRTVPARGTTESAAPASPAERVPVEVHERIGNRLLALLVRHGSQASALWKTLATENFSTPAQQELYRILHTRYSELEQGTGDRPIPDQYHGYVERLELFADQEFSGLEPGSITQEIQRCSTELRRHRITVELQRIAGQLRDVEHPGTDQQTSDGDFSALERAFRELTNELSSLHA